MAAYIRNEDAILEHLRELAKTFIRQLGPLSLDSGEHAKALLKRFEDLLPFSQADVPKEAANDRLQQANKFIDQQGRYAEGPRRGLQEIERLVTLFKRKA